MIGPNSRSHRLRASSQPWSSSHTLVIECFAFVFILFCFLNVFFFLARFSLRNLGLDCLIVDSFDLFTRFDFLLKMNSRHAVVFRNVKESETLGAAGIAVIPSHCVAQHLSAADEKTSEIEKRAPAS